jgi:DNA repair protein RadC
MDPSSLEAASLKDLLLPFFGKHTDSLLLQSEGRLLLLLKLARKLYAKQARLFDAATECARRASLEELGGQDCFSSPKVVCDYLHWHLGGREYETFVMLTLDSQHRLLRVHECFRGTLAQTSVYPREIVKRVLEDNAAATIFAHNHPSGVAEPSRADELLTQTLKQ